MPSADSVAVSRSGCRRAGISRSEESALGSNLAARLAVPPCRSGAGGDALARDEPGGGRARATSAGNLRQTGGVVMRFTVRRIGGMSWTVRAVVAALLVSGSTAATVGVAAAAQTPIRPAGSGSSAVVVQAAARTGFGKILVTVNGGHSLYEHPNGSCGPSCRNIWPPLLMPAGTTTPKGAS